MHACMVYNNYTQLDPNIVATVCSERDDDGICSTHLTLTSLSHEFYSTKRIFRIYLFSTNYRRSVEMIDWMVGVRVSFAATENAKMNIFKPKIHGICMIHAFNLWFLRVFRHWIHFNILSLPLPHRIIIGFSLGVIFMIFDIETHSTPSYTAKP